MELKSRWQRYFPQSEFSNQSYPTSKFKNELFQLPEHLQAHYNKWLHNENEKNSISQGECTSVEIP
jgi:hypothetical protein